MIISDLNHLEVAEKNIEGGFEEFDYIRGTVLFGSLTAGVAFGNMAVADSQSLALGYGTFTKAATSTYTTPFSSASGAFGLAVSN